MAKGVRTRRRRTGEEVRHQWLGPCWGGVGKIEGLVWGGLWIKGWRLERTSGTRDYIFVDTEKDCR